MDFKIKNEISNGFISGQDSFWLFQSKTLFFAGICALDLLTRWSLSKVNKLNFTRLSFCYCWNFQIMWLFMIKVGDKKAKSVKYGLQSQFSSFFDGNSVSKVKNHWLWKRFRQILGKTFWVVNLGFIGQQGDVEWLRYSWDWPHYNWPMSIAVITILKLSSNRV